MTPALRLLVALCIASAVTVGLARGPWAAVWFLLFLGVALAGVRRLAVPRSDVDVLLRVERRRQSKEMR